MRIPSTAFPGWFVVVAACTGQAESLLTANPPDSAAAVEFAIDLWPGEGIPVIEARRSVLQIHAAPDPDSPVIDSLRGRVGRRLAFDSTRYQTIQAGAIRVLQPMRVEGRDLGEVTHLSLNRYYQPNLPEAAIPLAALTTIDYLQNRAEGTCFVRIEGRVIDAQPCPGFGRESVKVLREPVTRWWVRVRGSGGAFGWLPVSDSTARSVRREF